MLIKVITAHDNKNHACFLASCVLVSVRLSKLWLVGSELRQYAHFLVSQSAACTLTIAGNQAIDKDV